MMAKSKRKYEADTSFLPDMKLHSNTQRSPKPGVKIDKEQQQQQILGQGQDLILGIIERIKKL